MPDFRAFWIPASPEPSEIVLDPEESHHLVAVNRAAAGDTVTVFDGKGSEWICELAAADRRAARLKVRFGQKARPLPHAMTLGQALPKGGGMDAIVRKATELGAARIIPLESERTQVHLAEGRSDRKIEKWQTAAIEAAKQCGNPWLPEIAPVQAAAAFMEGARDYELKLIASLQPGAQPLHAVLERFRQARGRPPRTALWLIGPEGDFTPAELSLARSCGFEGVTLGPLVLRCETAAIFALSVLGYELGRNP
ncbi:MAG TPA: RsmE family RNA methyltransferase [Opitutaceae bacterium]|nr:RsmE family RNA methyltransferase [Opitutaceae bacterium]